MLRIVCGAGGGFVFNTGDEDVAGNGVEIMWEKVIHEEGDLGNARGWGRGVQATCLLCVPIEAFHSGSAGSCLQCVSSGG